MERECERLFRAVHPARLALSIWRGCHNVEMGIVRVQNSLAYDVCRNIIIYTLHDFNTLITDHRACETVICIPIGTTDCIKSKTNCLNVNQRTGLSPDSRNV